MESNQPTSPERGPSVHLPTPEIGGQSQPETQQEGGERQESREQVKGVGAGDATPAQTSPSYPTAPTVPTDDSSDGANTTTHMADDTPLVAADEDLIEKAWVERAKQIVASTKDNPYEQEKEVSKLQADYLHKRYGKEVRLPDE